MVWLDDVDAAHQVEVEHLLEAWRSQDDVSECCVLHELYMYTSSILADLSLPSDMARPAYHLGGRLPRRIQRHRID